METTLFMIKPDVSGCEEKVSKILDWISKMEDPKVNIVKRKVVSPTRRQVEEHYRGIVGRPYYGGNLNFVSSGNLILMVLEGEGIIASMRRQIGSLSDPTSMRGQFGTENPMNAVHASDSPEEAQREINLWFPTEV